MTGDNPPCFLAWLTMALFNFEVNINRIHTATTAKEYSKETGCEAVTSLSCLAGIFYF